MCISRKSVLYIRSQIYQHKIVHYASLFPFDSNIGYYHLLSFFPDQPAYSLIKYIGLLKESGFGFTDSHSVLVFYFIDFRSIQSVLFLISCSFGNEFNEMAFFFWIYSLKYTVWYYTATPAFLLLMLVQHIFFPFFYFF